MDEDDNGKFRLERVNHFTSRPKCMPGSWDPGVTSKSDGNFRHVWLRNMTNDDGNLRHVW